MNRSAPRIAQADLRDHADPARVERIWQRIEVELPGSASSIKARRWRLAPMLVAAAFAGFGVGLAVSRPPSRSGPTEELVVREMPVRADVDVLAAGSESRSFGLPGGGSVLLKPGATMEMQRAAGAVTLHLVQGSASVETAPAGGDLAIVAGDARVGAQAGSVLNVSRNVDKLDVEVRAGGASITSPDGSKRLASGERADAPIHPAARPVALATASPATGGGRPQGAPHRVVQPAPAESSGPLAVAGPEWMELYGNNDWRGALTALQAQPGGVTDAIRSATNAKELMAIRDVLGRDHGAANAARQRVLDEFDKSDAPRAAQAAGELGEWYAGQGEAARADGYFERATKLAPAGSIGERAACNRIQLQDRVGHKEEAVRLAKEYGKAHPRGGICKVEAERIASGEDASDPVPAAAPSGSPSDHAPAVAPTGSAPSDHASGAAPAKDRDKDKDKDKDKPERGKEPVEPHPEHKDGRVP